MKRYIAYALLIHGVFIFDSFALDKLKCLSESITFANDEVILNSDTKKGGLYLLHNITGKTIWIDHPNAENPRLTSGWSSALKPDHWSAVVVGQRNFNLKCSSSKSNALGNLECEQTIFVCKTSILKNRKVRDDYWYIEDVSDDEVKRALFAKLKSM